MDLTSATAMLLPKKNRSRQEIICDVLESAKEPTPKSHLLSKAHISWPQLLSHLLLLQRTCMIEEILLHLS